MSDVLHFEAGRISGDARPDYGVVGDPIEHSLSPALHAAALAQRGRDEMYSAIHVAAGDLGAFLAHALETGMRGLNLTLPHKETVLDHVTRRSGEVDAIGAANALVVRDGDWVAHNTDARGLSLALSREVGRDLPSYLDLVVVLGAGGAARAAWAALEALGARRIHVLSRRREAAAWAEARGATWARLDDPIARRATLLLQATPLGLAPEDPLPIPADHIPREALVLDMVYGVATPLLEQARARDCVAVDGLPMLVAQAALSFSLWFGAEAPLDAMAQAVGLRW